MTTDDIFLIIFIAMCALSLVMGISFLLLRSKKFKNLTGGTTWLENAKSSFKDLKWYEWVMMSVMIGIALFDMCNSIFNPDAITPVWLTVVNFFSALTGVINIFFCAKASMTNFLFAQINTVLYAIFAYYYKMTGTFALEAFYYLPFNLVAWFAWARHRDQEEKHITKAKKLVWWQYIAMFALIIAVTIATKTLFEEIAVGSWTEVTTQSEFLKAIFPWLDCGIFAIGIVAFAMEIFRFSEQYILWTISDIFAVIMYGFISFTPVYFTKKVIYLIMAIIGLINWLKLNKTRNIVNE